MVAQVETWSTGVPDLPLNSRPFAAEAAILMTPPPPGMTDPPPPVKVPPSPALPASKPPAASGAPDPAPSFRPPASGLLGRLVVGAVIVAGIAAAYVAMR
jgi:hypothetical protein